MHSNMVWALRALWFLLPLTVGRAASAAVSSAEHGVPQVATIGLWLLWAGAMVATAVPIPASLTLIRFLAPGALAVAAWSLFDSSGSALSVVGVVHAVAVVAVTLHQLIGDRFADGASYGDERRMLLRPPAQLMVFALPLTWLVMTVGLAAGPLFLANKQWLVGVLASAAGAAVLVFGARALHQLTKRWVIFVPTGMVLHDATVLTEPTLFRRTAIERLGAAITGTPARDLSRGASGLLLECELADAAPLGLLASGQRGGEATMTDVRRFLFAPTRPGALLDEAENRNIAVD